jgi:hypothetical protein
METVNEKTVFKKGISRCLYCNSPSYGRGCRFAPKGVHFHPDDSKKCSYCGSASYGRGCKLNPFGDIHLHGIDYNKMFTESLKNKFLLRELNKKYEDFEAFKLGIINSNGDKIKEPTTVQEQAAYSAETKTILKIKKYLGTKLDLINQTTILESASKLNYNKENHKKVLEFEQRINDIVAELHKTTDKALKEGLTVEQVQALL